MRVRNLIAVRWNCEGQAVANLVIDSGGRSLGGFCRDIVWSVEDYSETTASVPAKECNFFKKRKQLRRRWGPLFGMRHVLRRWTLRPAVEEITCTDACQYKHKRGD